MSSASIRQSRSTFAMMLAAAILRLRASPFTTASCGHGKSRTGSPSISTISGSGPPSAATARRIAKWVARRIFSRSISSTLASPDAHLTRGSSVNSA